MQDYKYISGESSVDLISQKIRLVEKSIGHNINKVEKAVLNSADNLYQEFKNLYGYSARLEHAIDIIRNQGNNTSSEDWYFEYDTNGLSNNLHQRDMRNLPKNFGLTDFSEDSVLETQAIVNDIVCGNVDRTNLNSFLQREKDIYADGEELNNLLKEVTEIASVSLSIIKNEIESLDASTNYVLVNALKKCPTIGKCDLNTAQLTQFLDLNDEALESCVEKEFISGRFSPYILIVALGKLSLENVCKKFRDFFSEFTFKKAQDLAHSLQLDISNNIDTIRVLLRVKVLFSLTNHDKEYSLVNPIKEFLQTNKNKAKSKIYSLICMVNQLLNEAQILENILGLTDILPDYNILKEIIDSELSSNFSKIYHDTESILQETEAFNNLIPEMHPKLKNICSLEFKEDIFKNIASRANLKYMSDYILDQENITSAGVLLVISVSIDHAANAHVLKHISDDESKKAVDIVNPIQLALCKTLDLLTLPLTIPSAIQGLSPVCIDQLAREFVTSISFTSEVIELWPYLVLTIELLLRTSYIQTDRRFDLCIAVLGNIVQLVHVLDSSLVIDLDIKTFTNYNIELLLDSTYNVNTQLNNISCISPARNNIKMFVKLAKLREDYMLKILESITTNTGKLQASIIFASIFSEHGGEWLILDKIREAQQQNIRLCSIDLIDTFLEVNVNNCIWIQKRINELPLDHHPTLKQLQNILYLPIGHGNISLFQGVREVLSKAIHALNESKSLDTFLINLVDDLSRIKRCRMAVYPFFSYIPCSENSNLIGQLCINELKNSNINLVDTPQEASDDCGSRSTIKYFLNINLQFIAKEMIYSDYERFFYPVCESTITLADEFIKSLTPDDTRTAVFVAGTQTKGIGQNNNVWIDSSNKNATEESRTELLLTLVCPIPDIELSLYCTFPRFACIAGIKAIKELKENVSDDQDESDLPVYYKWPNDIILYGNKVSGVLGKTVTSSDNRVYLSLSIGINVYTKTEEISKLLKPRAIFPLGSLNFGSVSQLEALFLKNIFSILSNIRQETNNLQQYMTQYSVFYNKKVQIKDGDEVFEGIYSGETISGFIILLTADMEYKQIANGTITTICNDNEE